MPHADIVLITGANTGIGYQIVRALAGSEGKYEIVVAGRSIDKAQAAIDSGKAEFSSTSSKLYPLQVDLESDKSINAAFEKVQTQFGRVDVLINNAGSSFDALVPAGKMTSRENWMRTWNVNTAGIQIMTETFAPLLLRSSSPRLLFMTSGASTLGRTENSTARFDKSPAKGWPKQGMNAAAYRSSKTGMNMMMREWYRLLHEDGVRVWCISPGFLATNLGGAGPEVLKKMGAGDPEIVGPFIISVLQGARDADVGKIITKDGIQEW